MARRIKTFPDGSYLEFDRGKFDRWCVYYVNPRGFRFAPKDIEYFTDLQDLAATYSITQVYESFVKVYIDTNQEILPSILSLIDRESRQYSSNSLRMAKLLSILYAGMIAEENKKGTILKKRIKRLGVHQLLIEAMPPVIAASFSRNKNWQILDQECKVRGF
jgi:hypothetical protein